ncbi:hypothetical protein, partial [Bartonella bovis]|uniref:hypothetical protein n=1 Tax=Bartonella bovis TaxID=155194 RepID=UPI000552CE1B
MSGSGMLEMMGGTEITFAGGTGSYGVKVGSGGNALLNSVSITGSGDKSTGVEVSEGNLVMHKGSVEFKGNYGVTMSGGQALFYGVSI